MNKTQQGFDIRSNSPVDSRFQFDTINEMNRYPKDRIPSGCITFCKEDGKHYKFVRTDENALNGGSWEVLISGGGGNDPIFLTKTEFEALSDKKSNVLYCIYKD